MKSPQMLAYEEILKRFTQPCFSTSMGIMYFEPSTEGFIYGTLTNCGIKKCGEYVYNENFSINDNVQAMVEQAESDL